MIKRVCSRESSAQIFSVPTNKRTGIATPLDSAQFSAVHDNQRAEFARFVVRRLDRNRRRQQCGRQKHREARDRREPAVPERQRQNNERRRRRNRAARGTRSTNAHRGADSEAWERAELRRRARQSPAFASARAHSRFVRLRGWPCYPCCSSCSFVCCNRFVNRSQGCRRTTAQDSQFRAFGQTHGGRAGW